MVGTALVRRYVDGPSITAIVTLYSAPPPRPPRV